MTNRTTTRKLLRAVRLDDSDLEVFEVTAEPGEWMVPGGFEFLSSADLNLGGKQKQAFHSGFLGVRTFGRATLAAITLASEGDFNNAVQQLTENLFVHCGAPDRAAAAKAAMEEVRFAESLCAYDENTLIAVERELTEDGVSERFKRFIPTGADWEQSKPLVYVEDRKDS
ncbi:MAG: DUF6505 family protein [Gammaproteobacteria bacterium]|nr:DUF6505 family protein [Gammaproteobacteria bacterium]